MTTATTNLTEHGAIAEAIQPYIDGAAKAALRAAEGRALRASSSVTLRNIRSVSKRWLVVFPRDT